MKDLPVTKGTEKGIAVKILPPQDLASRVSEVHAMIARRAYERLFNSAANHAVFSSGPKATPALMKIV